MFFDFLSKLFKKNAIFCPNSLFLTSDRLQNPAFFVSV